MKNNNMEETTFTEKEISELEKFGMNSWFVEELLASYKNNSTMVNESWQDFFDRMSGKPVTAKPAEISNGNGSLIGNIPMPKPAAGEEAVVLRGVGAKIVENMSYSLSLPLATSFRTIPVKILEENRAIINNFLKKSNRGKLSFTHFIGWAIVKALKAHPVMNNAYTVMNGEPHVIRKPQINLGLAVDQEKKDGSRSLIVPNIKNAGAMNFVQFFAAYDDIIRRARANKIEPADFMGTTISLTNPGTVGTVSSNPRLMVGQGAIIATGAIDFPAQYHGMPESNLSAMGISKVMNVTSTYDHRIIQGAESGLFLKKLHELLLGEDGFYDEIFEALQLPVKPAQWQVDNYPMAFGKSQDFELIEKQARILEMVNMFRVRGHLLANLDPLTPQMLYHPELDSQTYGFTVWDNDREFITGGLAGKKKATLKEILDILHQTYCDRIGVEFRHIQSPEEKAWLQERMESSRNTGKYSKEEKKQILKKLIEAESFERFLHTKFVGSKRFSLEGSETIIAVLDAMLQWCGDDGVKEVVLGMAHRGRLNVLANIIGKSYQKIFSEFEGHHDPHSAQGSGDVKYHLGATGNYPTRSGKSVKISVAPNPSHLEFVNPVVEGIVRAKQTRMPGEYNKNVMAVLIHGDAAFAGQGVVAETLNLSQLKGYRTRGTLHLIINNQIGFTTTPEAARSSTYSSDVARMVQAPIFHVNGDDPEASLWVTQLAFEYRQKFEKDVVIDVLGYRRHGHNEGDEPGYTQPVMYKKIKDHDSVKEFYGVRLIGEKVITVDEFKAMESDFYQALNTALDAAKQKAIPYQSETPLAISEEAAQAAPTSQGTAVSGELLAKVVEGLTRLPHEFTLHPKLQSFIDTRKKFMHDDGVTVDWAFGEALAFGTLLMEGTPIRLSGEDISRGTFSHRHLALTDMNTDLDYIPMNFIEINQSKIEAVDSLLSETAVLGFEFGYSIADPLTLVLWEAQFGDFSNVAQPIIDNFIASCKSKWSLSTSLVMLLPHGYEGQGPEHSSARLERYLQLCAEDNMIVCNLTTPAQYFHALRRQIRQKTEKPLIIMTPKSLLRLPDARSYKHEFTNGTFHEILDDATVTDRQAITRVIISAGKVHYDLVKFRIKNNRTDVALVRLEQIYPYDADTMKRILASYPNAATVAWTQEEPRNMGSWNFLLERLTNDLTAKQKLVYAGRKASASPAVGSLSVHQAEQEQLVRDAFEL